MAARARLVSTPPTGFPVLARSAKNAVPSAAVAEFRTREACGDIAGAELRGPGDRDDTGEAVIAGAPRLLEQANRPSPFRPGRRSAGRGRVADAERRIGVAYAIAERPAETFHSARQSSWRGEPPEATPCPRPPSAKPTIGEAHRARVAVTEHRLDSPPAAPPVLTGPRRFAGPFFNTAVLAERLAEGTRRIDRQFLGRLRRQVVGGHHGGRRRLAAAGSIPPAIPTPRQDGRPAARPRQAAHCESPPPSSRVSVPRTPGHCAGRGNSAAPPYPLRPPALIAAMRSPRPSRRRERQGRRTATEQMGVAGVAPAINRVEVEIPGVRVRPRKPAGNQVRQHRRELGNALPETAGCHLRRNVAWFNAEAHGLVLLAYGQLQLKPRKSEMDFASSPAALVHPQSPPDPELPPPC